jgi:hypothetical protein
MKDFALNQSVADIVQWWALVCTVMNIGVSDLY